MLNVGGLKMATTRKMFTEDMIVCTRNIIYHECDDRLSAVVTEDHYLLSALFS